MEIRSRTEHNFRSRRLVTAVVAALTVGACADVTQEGTITKECINSNAVHTLKPGNSIYLGDYVQGMWGIKDTFRVLNAEGKIGYEQSAHDENAKDDGTVRPLGPTFEMANETGEPPITVAPAGFVYTENHIDYQVTYSGNSAAAGSIDVKVKTSCPRPSIGPVKYE